MKDAHATIYNMKCEYIIILAYKLYSGLLNSKFQCNKHKKRIFAAYKILR